MGDVARDSVLGKFSWNEASSKLVNALTGWSAERYRAIAPNLSPSRLPISVIIPTHNREDILQLTLKGYQDQSLHKNDFEIILVNDHGRKEELGKVVQDFSSKLQLTFFENEGTNGPGAARNLAIRASKGEIVLITGDDIIPHSDLLELHVHEHRKYSELETAFVGLNSWHSDLDLTWLMKHIVGAGGQQFNYNEMRDGEPVPFDRFYTSNVSIKRRFLAGMENLFNPWFRLAAFEDIELAYRLHLRGMQLRYIEGAVGYHYHQMNIRTMSERQRRCGRMLTIMAQMHPKFVCQPHQMYLEALRAEFHRKNLAAENFQDEASPDSEWREMSEFFIRRFESIEKLLENPDLSRKPENAPHLQDELVKVDNYLSKIRNQLFDGVLDLMLRVGMSEEWSEGSTANSWAADWIANFSIPEIFRTPFSYDNLPNNLPASQPKRILEHVVSEAELQLHLQRKELQQLKDELHGLRGWITQFSISGRMKHKIKTVSRKIMTFGH